MNGQSQIFRFSKIVENWCKYEIFWNVYKILKMQMFQKVYFVTHNPGSSTNMLSYKVSLFKKKNKC